MPPENFPEPNCVECRKMPFQAIGEKERVQYEGQFLPLLPPPSVVIPGFSLLSFDFEGEKYPRICDEETCFVFGTMIFVFREVKARSVS